MRFFNYSSVCQSNDVLSDSSVSHHDVWVDTESFELVSSVSETKNCFFVWLQVKFIVLKA